jgi:hypothetical protein
VEQLTAENEPRLAVVEYEGAVREAVQGKVVMAPPLGLQPLVNRVRTRLADQLEEAVVVLAPAQRTRAVARSERCRLVEEEELGEPPGLQQGLALPPLELEPAGDPPLRRLAVADAALVVVKAAAVAVDEPTRRVGDELAQRRHAVLQRHSY